MIPSSRRVYGCVRLTLKALPYPRSDRYYLQHLRPTTTRFIGCPLLTLIGDTVDLRHFVITAGTRPTPPNDLPVKTTEGDISARPWMKSSQLWRVKNTKNTSMPSLDGVIRYQFHQREMALKFFFFLKSRHCTSENRPSVVPRGNSHAGHASRSDRTISETAQLIDEWVFSSFFPFLLRGRGRGGG